MRGLAPSEVLAQIGETQADQDAFVSRWLDATYPHAWQLELADTSQKQQLRHRCAAFLHTFVAAAKHNEQLTPEAAIMREPLQHLSFICGWLAGNGLPIAAALALVFGFQDALAISEPSFFRNLAISACSAHGVGQAQQAQAEHRLVIEKSQIVAALQEDAIALFLVGDPDREVLSEAVGRLMMMAAQREPKRLFVDASGLFAPDSCLEDAMMLLAAHQLATDIPVAVSGAPGQMFQSLEQHPKLKIKAYERLEHALEAHRG